MPLVLSEWVLAGRRLRGEEGWITLYYTNSSQYHASYCAVDCFWAPEISWFIIWVYIRKRCLKMLKAAWFITAAFLKVYVLKSPPNPVHSAHPGFSSVSRRRWNMAIARDPESMMWYKSRKKMSRNLSRPQRLSDLLMVLIRRQLASGSRAPCTRLGSFTWIIISVNCEENNSDLIHILLFIPKLSTWSK